VSDASRSEEALRERVVAHIERAVSGQSIPLRLDTLEQADAAFRIANDWIEAQSVTGLEVGRPGQGRTLNFTRVDE
jgi:hypothetical protein